MYRRITLLKRRPGMSPEAFRDYYETHHRRIGEEVLAGHALRYVRRYVAPIGDGPLPDFDVVLEIDFADQAAHDRCIVALSQPAVAKRIAEDEEQVFDRSATLSFIVEECESSLPRPDGPSAA